MFGYKSLVLRALMRLVSQIERLARSARLGVVRYLPPGVKAVLKTGPLRVVIDTLDRLEATVVTQSLSRNGLFEPSAEYMLASASMSIVVPIHDAPLVTMRCLASLERNAPKSEVILVDDGSRLVETTHVIQEFSSRNGWKVLRHEKPGGHSAACAAGASVASRPYLCLLNSDTVVTPWCWRPLQQAFENDSSICLAGPSTSFSGGNEQTFPVAKNRRFEWSDSQICAFAERLIVAPLQPVLLDLPWVAGFALFIRRSLWEKLGGFDQQLPDYANEVELCTRVANSGYRTVWARNAYIHHFGGQSYGKLMTAQEIKSRNTAGLQYMRNKHNLQPPTLNKAR
jgi:GT2 family glycosyltransferase